MVDWTNSRQQRQLSVTQYNPIIDGYSHKTTGSIAGSNRSRRPSWSDAKKDFIEDDEAFSDAHTQLLKNLDLYYRKVKRQLLAFQSLPTGLFPNHLEPKKKVAHVVENVFCAISVWSLRQCYIKIDNDQGRAHELGQAAVKCMRGILNCWMKQAVKLEIFKGEQSPKDALHSKFNVYDGSEVSGADEVGQLQICAISLYLLTIAQMITSGLQIIYSIDEVNFIQQLVFYIERAYRTPDYGIWGRGSKYNNNTCELHASSIGMAKAALETMNGFNLYGERGASWSVVYVDIDAHNRNRTTFDTLLPRESASKNTDAALLFTVSWPAFSIHDTNLVQTTIKKCIRKLRGSYGFKRFLRDGQYTTIEPKDKRFYEASEIKKFDKNECEWPMFFALMVIDGLFKNNQPQIDEYLGLLNPLLRRTTEGEMMIHYFYIDQAKQQSSSQSETSERGGGNNQNLFVPSQEILNGNFFLLGQSVWIICQLLLEKLLTVSDLDPIRRYLPPYDRPKANARYSSIQDSVRYQHTQISSLKALQSPDNKRQSIPNSRSDATYSDLVIHVVPISESVRLQQVLATYGIQTQTPKQIEPITIWPPGELVKAYGSLGVNEKFGFSGRPNRPIGVLGTCKVYRICSKTVVAYPLTFETNDFYMSADHNLLLDNIRSDFEFLTKCWKLKGRPIYIMLLREQHLRGPQKAELLELLTQIRQGKLSSNITVRLERLQTSIAAACIEHLDFLNFNSEAVELHFNPVNEPKSVHESGQYKSLTDMSKLPIIFEDLDYVNHDFKNRSPHELREILKNTDTSVSSLRIQTLCVYELYKQGGLELMIDHRRVREYLEMIGKEAAEIQHWSILRFVSSILHKMVDSLAPALTNLLVRGKTVTIGVFGHDETVIDKPMRPKEIFDILYGDSVFGRSEFHAVLLQELLINVSTLMSTNPQLFNGILKLRLGWILEAMKLGLDNFKADIEDLVTLNTLSPNEVKQLLYYVLTFNVQLFQDRAEAERRTYFQKRQMDGALCRVPIQFFEHAWYILEKTPGGIKLCDYLLPQQPTLSDMTDYELNFSLKIDEMLSRISDPPYRCLVVEMFELINVLLRRNPELRFLKTLDFDYLISEAVQLFKQQTNPPDAYSAFYNLPISLLGSTGFMIKAIIGYLFDPTAAVTSETNIEICKIS